MLSNLNEEIDLLDRHLEILDLVVENDPIGIVRLSNETGYAHHEVRYSLRVLEDDGLIEATSQGAIPTEQTDEFIAEADDRLAEMAEKLHAMQIGETDKPNVRPA